MVCNPDVVSLLHLTPEIASKTLNWSRVYVGFRVWVWGLESFEINSLKSYRGGDQFWWTIWSSRWRWLTNHGSGKSSTSSSWLSISSWRVALKLWMRPCVHEWNIEESSHSFLTSLGRAISDVGWMRGTFGLRHFSLSLSLSALLGTDFYSAPWLPFVGPGIGRT